jgi:3-methyladenine DNA glycosylase AlkC
MLLKNIFDKRFFSIVVAVFNKHIPDFDDKKFLKMVMDKEWGNRELKERMRHITLCLREFFPEHYIHCLPILLAIVSDLKEQENKGIGLAYIFLPDFIEVYGLDHCEDSLLALGSITSLVSAEFAIRPFIIKYPKQVMKQMLHWSKHSDHHVRRLASEGCRPRLPWAMAIPHLKKDPSDIFPVLENLKNDESEYVRRSVANNLNDIAKDNPELVIRTAGKWVGKSTHTDKILKHGCRTLLKKAHPEALKHFGFHVCKVMIKDLALSKKKIKIGDTLDFSFKVEVLQKLPARLRIEYGIYYVKSNGNQNRKIFQITERDFSKAEICEIKRKQRFTDFTTRKHHPGLHKLSIVVNGKEMADVEFNLTA